MQFAIALLATFGILLGSASTPVAVASIESEYTLALAEQQGAPAGRLEVDIDTNEGGGAWYTSPVWLAIGALALIVLVLLVVMAARGGGTTVVRD